DLLCALNCVVVPVNEDDPHAALIQKLEAAINFHAYGGFHKIQSVRQEAQMHWDLIYQLALAESIATSIVTSAREAFTSQQIKDLSLERRDFWSRTHAEIFFYSWETPEGIDDDVGDVRLAAGLLLQMAYRRRYRWSRGQLLINHALSMRPMERAASILEALELAWERRLNTQDDQRAIQQNQLPPFNEDMVL
ncbi:MAG: hypothetical protein Q9224_006744, partial [Gallowayella concinna]